jgi:hypothetical protein
MRTYYVGLDVHAASIVVVIMNGAGKVLEQNTIQSNAGAVRSYLQRLKGEVLVAFEEGTQAQWLYDCAAGPNSRLLDEHLPIKFRVRAW